MKNKIASILIILSVLFALIGMFFLTLDKKNSLISQKFQEKQDSLIKITDSLENQLVKDSIEIKTLEFKSNYLSFKLTHLKPKIEYIEKKVDSSKKSISSYSDTEIANFFSKRYPNKDTSSLVILTKYPLIEGAKELIEFDGLKKIDAIKDTMLSIKDSIITNKDAIISIKDSSILKYQLISKTKDIQIADYKIEHLNLKKENKKLRAINKITKIVGFVSIALLIIK